MKIVRLDAGWGILDGDEIALLPTFAFDAPVADPDRRIPRDSVRLLAPVALTRNIFCLGRNYAEHIKEGPGAAAGLPANPIWFSKLAINDPDGDIVVPAGVTESLDYEVELAVVIGQGGRNIPVESALDHVFGYTILNDISARDVQNGRGGQWFLGKNLDGSCPVGPCIVTSDEIPDPQALTVALRVNGEERQRASTADMIFSVAVAIADLARYLTLQPGDVIATGTPSGVAMGMKPPRWLQNGDVIEAEIHPIGTLRNRVVIQGG